MESDPLVQQSSEVVQELSPEEQELLKSFIESNPDQFKEIVKQEVAQEKDETEMEGRESEMMEDDEIGMNDQEFQVRRIIHKIVNYVSVGSALSIVPAAMFISGGVALGLGVTALVGTTMKDAAFWKRGGKYTDHHYKAQEKSDMMDMKEEEPENGQSPLVGMTANVYDDYNETTNKGYLKILSVEEPQAIPMEIYTYEKQNILQKIFGGKSIMQGITPGEVRNKFIVDVSGAKGTLWFSCENPFLHFDTDGSQEILFSKNLMKALIRFSCEKVADRGTVIPFDKKTVQKANFNKKVKSKDLQENKKHKKIKITESQLMRLVKKTVNEEEDNIVPCSQLGIKSDGFCDKTTKKVLTSVPCTKLGVKSPGMCDTKTKKPV
jgi:hypothetical protein